MSFVITQSCAGVCDTGCVDVCPVDCIAGPVPVDTLRAVEPTNRKHKFPSVQLFIDPDECICCAACVPECPEDAIVDGSTLAADDPDKRRNAAFFGPAR